MASWSLVWPALGAVAAGLVACVLQRRLRPAAAVALLTALAGFAAAATVAVVALFASAFVVQLAGTDVDLRWCVPITAGHRVPLWLGGSALAGMAAMGVSAIRAARQLRVRPLAADSPLVVLPTDRVAAFAVPGRPGHVVVSAGMLRQLDGAERRVLLAHERAHLAHHHHRYVRVVAVAAAAVPPLLPMLARVRLATERWADESAVEVVGDRELVARTIARAALAQGQSPALAFGGGNVLARVDALLADPVGSTATITTAVLTTLVAGVASASLQLHHVAAALEHLCP